jgi:hypothetical protein
MEAMTALRSIRLRCWRSRRRVDEAVAEPQVLRKFLLASDLNRKDFCGGLDGDVADAELDLAGRQLRVDGRPLARHHLSGHGHHRFRAGAVQGGEAGGALGHHALRQTVMVAQIDEQHPPWSRLRCTQPERRTVLPESAARRAPQVWVR